jgi:hypothetical protein
VKNRAHCCLVSAVFLVRKEWSLIGIPAKTNRSLVLGVAAAAAPDEWVFASEQRPEGRNRGPDGKCDKDLSVAADSHSANQVRDESDMWRSFTF